MLFIQVTVCLGVSHAVMARWHDPVIAHQQHEIAQINLTRSSAEVQLQLSLVQDLVLLEPAVLVNSFDVTSQKEVEAELEAAKKQLLMYVRALDQLSCCSCRVVIHQHVLFCVCSVCGSSTMQSPAWIWHVVHKLLQWIGNKHGMHGVGGALKATAGCRCHVSMVHWTLVVVLLINGLLQVFSSMSAGNSSIKGLTHSLIPLLTCWGPAGGLGWGA